MPYEIAVDRERGLIEIHVIGETDPLEALEARNRAALISAELGFNKVAVYGQRLDNIQGFSPAILFNFATSFKDKPFPAGTKFAIFISDVSGAVNTLAKIARDHGTRMQVFRDQNMAEDWLVGDLATAELETF